MNFSFTNRFLVFLFVVFAFFCSESAFAQTPTVTSPVNYCKDATASPLSATPSVGTSTLRWYTVATGGTFSSTPYTPSTATVGTVTYYVSEFDGISEGPRASISVITNALPANPVAVTPVDYCQNTTAASLVAFGTSLKWYTAATGGVGSSTAPTPSTTTVGVTTYYVTQSSGTPVCESLREPVSVTVKATPVAPTVTTPLNYCVGAPVPTLSATGSGLKWYTVASGGTGSTTAPTPSSGSAGTQIYYVSQTDPTTGCEGPRAMITVNINAFPVAGTTVAETSGLAANDGTICNGASVTISGTGGGTYTWSTGATTSSIVVSPSASTTYTVTVSNVGCTTTATRLITVNPLPSPAIAVTETSGTTADDGNICIGTSATLTASGGTSYSWSTGATTAAISVSPTTTTVYTVTVTNANNCSATLTRTITVNPLPTITVSVSETSGLFPNDAIVCNGGSAVLTATGGGTYQWWYAGTAYTTSPVWGVGFAGVGTFPLKVVVTSTFGCVDSFTKNILTTPTPTASIAVTETSGTTANDAITCAGDNVNLTASGGGTYSWSTGATTASISVAPTVTTTYTVTVTDPTYNCSATSTKTITVNPLPSGTVAVAETSGVAPNDGIICLGASADLTAPAGATYSWSTGASTASITVSPAVTTTYTVTVTNANNCINTFTRTITVNTIPTGAIAVTETSGVANNDAITCAGASVSLTASGGSSYLWSTGATTAAISVSPTTTTSYSVTVTATGCASGAVTKTITVNPLPSISGSSTACVGKNITLTGSGTPHATTPWASSVTSVATISTVGVVTPIAAGTTTITYKNNLNCDVQMVLTVNPIPAKPTVSSPLTLCYGALASPLTATGSSLLWYTDTTLVGSSTPITPSTVPVGVTSYYVSQSLLGCESPRAAIVVNVVSLPASPTVSTPTYTYCQDAPSPITLSAIGTGIKWYVTATGGTPSTTAPTPSTSTPGIYKYYVVSTSASSPFCESPRSEITVTVNPKPVVSTSAASSTFFCVGDSVILNSTTSIFNGFGNTNFLNGTAASGALTSCDCPNGSVAVGYQGSTGAWIDQFALICKPIDRFGVLGATTSITAYNGINVGPSPKGPFTFGGTDMLIGLRAKDENFTPNQYLGEIAAYGQSQSYINGYGNNSLSPSSLSVIAGGSAATVLGTIYTPNGTVATGMIKYPTFYAAWVSLKYTPIGAYKYNYLWSSASTDTNASVTIKTSGSYTLTVTNSLGCSTVTSPINVTVNPFPTPTIAVTETSGVANNDAIICNTASATLTAGGGATYSWNTGATTAAITVSPSSTTTYTVTVTSAGLCSSVKTQTITVNPLPTPATSVSETSGTTANDGIICAGASASMTASGGTSYVWSTGATTATISVTPATTTTYTVTVTNANNCSATATRTITVNPLPTPSTTVSETSGTTADDGIICAGASASITASGGTSYLWSTGATTATISVTPASTTTYTVTVTNANNCSATTTRTITVNPLPTPAVAVTETSGVANNDAIICVGASATLTASGGATYLWNTGATTAAITQSPAATTTYTVTVTSAAGCQATTTRTITVNPLPTPSTAVTETSGTTANDAIICVGASATITASGGTSYVWNTGATTAAILVSPTTTTTYTVTVTNANNCSATTTRTITVNPLPTATTSVTETSGTTANDGIICIGATATITAVGGTSYVWNTGATTAAISVTPASTTTYTVTVTNANGCQATATRIITVNPLPTPSIVSVVENSGVAANDAITCAGATVAITAGGGTSYTWSTGSTSNPLSVAPTATTTYTVTVTNANGCQATTTQLITVNPLPTPSTTVAETSGTTANDAITCAGDNAAITASGGVSYVWNTGAITAAITVAPTVTTTYTVTVTNANNCSATTTRTITVNPLPTAAIAVAETSGNTNNDGIICLGTSAKMTASGGTSYVWSTGATTPIITVTPTTTTTYTVTVTNANNCSSTATRTITVNSNPTLSLSSSSPYGFIFCRDQYVVVTANAPTATSYKWRYSGINIAASTSDTVWANKTGYWGVIVTDVNGCFANDSAWVQEDTSEESIISPTVGKICEEGSILITCHPGYVSYTFEWLHNGLPLLPITTKEHIKTATAAGLYTVYVTNSVGCIDTVEATITNYPKPIKPIISYTAPLMEVAKTYHYYQWFRNGAGLIGANSYQYTTTVPGLYHVQVTDTNGCLNNSDTIEIMDNSSVRTTINQGAIKIYPNPTQSIVNIESPIIVNVIVHDLTGRKVFQAVDVHQVNLENFADGTYVFRVYDEMNQLITIQKITKSSSR